MKRLLPIAAVISMLSATPSFAEGSKDLYPATYDSAGSRANLDLQASKNYMERVSRSGFHYVYVEAGEYIVLGSSNRAVADSADILVYKPQDFGVPGDETIPANSDYSCESGPAITSESHYSGSGYGYIRTRANELAGANSPDNLTTETDGYRPCAYQAPVTGIYGVEFESSGGGSGTSSGPNGSIRGGGGGGVLPRVRNSVAAWDITVRPAEASTSDIDGRVFSYAIVGFTGGNDRPVFTTHYYVTTDGYRYQQDLRGLDPNGYALYANTFGFLDSNQPLYKNLRGEDFSISPLPFGITPQPAQFPIFYADIGPSAPNVAEAEKVLNELGIPLIPPSPQIADVAFVGSLGAGSTSLGNGGEFSFATTDTVSYQIVISRDGSDFDPANPANRLLSGIAYTGSHVVIWDGLDNNLEPFPAQAQAYPYKAYGRNGEVHFPIIDAENNGNPNDTNVPGGGPTITRLNGLSPGDETVFFDDRGYVTASGEFVGELNGDLCAGATDPSFPDTPNVDLIGVVSSTDYRLWDYGRNANTDCAKGAGWGDAKALNLWTYFLTNSIDQELTIEAVPIDLASTVGIEGYADAGDNVVGSFSFVNNGGEALGVSYTLSFPPGLGTVSFVGLTAGITAFYDNPTGNVTFTGLPSIMASGASFGGTFELTAPPTGSVIVNSNILTTDADTIPENDSDQATLVVGGLDLATTIAGVPATAEPGSKVSGAVTFSNNGITDATGVTYQFQIGEAGNIPSGVVFTSLPAGAAAVHDPITGTVTITGLPATLPTATLYSIAFEYDAPLEGSPPVIVESGIATALTENNLTNNDALASTAFGYSASARIDIDIQPICVQDVPYFDYTITPVNFTPSNLATIELIGSDSAVVETLSNRSFTGRLIWPEASVDGTGTGLSWPGWDFVGGVWIEVPSTVRPELTVRVSVNPTEEVTVSYPPATPNCSANPPNARLTSTGTHAVPVMPLPFYLLTVFGVLLITQRNVRKTK